MSYLQKPFEKRCKSFSKKNKISFLKIFILLKKIEGGGGANNIR